MTTLPNKLSERESEFGSVGKTGLGAVHGSVIGQECVDSILLQIQQRARAAQSQGRGGHYF